MSSTHADIKVLNGLIEGLVDCSDGYREAAAQVSDPRYSQWFSRRADERVALAEALKREVRTRGGTPEDNRSILAKAQRAFAGFAQAVLGNRQSVFGEVMTSEARMKQSLEAARDDASLSASARVIVQSGLEQIAAAESDLAALADYLDERPAPPPARPVPPMA